MKYFLILILSASAMAKVDCSKSHKVETETAYIIESCIDECFEFRDVSKYPTKAFSEQYQDGEFRYSLEYEYKHVVVKEFTFQSKKNGESSAYQKKVRTLETKSFTGDWSRNQDTALQLLIDKIEGYIATKHVCK